MRALSIDNMCVPTSACADSDHVSSREDWTVRSGSVVLPEQSPDTRLPTGPWLIHSLAALGGGTFCLSNHLWPDEWDTWRQMATFAQTTISSNFCTGMTSI